MLEIGNLEVDIVKKEPKENTKRRAYYKFERELFEEFKELCKENRIKQVQAFEAFMKAFITAHKSQKLWRER